MTDSTGFLPALQSLEAQLHLQATRNNANIVDELLHDDFEETRCLDNAMTKTVNSCRAGKWKLTIRRVS
ncbi:hypothetical protein I6G64_25315 [Serratia plymuthica]|uniref:Uncharacterized protein n=1 Tax=Serratia plymuthica TaxID=82996 RepID=A0A7T2SSI2_SERPL|nr:hypothetical protein [Serratia plymuthica]QPS20824.1 hypothetical protein I6G64_25315 [Serratia plymuthica]